VTATPSREAVRRMERGEVGHVVDLLERDFAPPAPREPGGPAARAGIAPGTIPNQYLLDALDRGEYDRFVLWPGHDPIGLLYFGPTGTLVPAGDPAAGASLAEAAERIGWRVLVGDAPIGWALLHASNRGVFRRRGTAREQRFMAVERDEGLDLDVRAPPGFRLACEADVEVLADYACRLHVEDRMGPPIARSARSAVRARVRETIAREATFVIDRDGLAVGKADLSLRSRRRGGQIAGVYVDASVRGQGVATGLVGELVRMLLRDGLPGVSLHVRSDNAPAIAAYQRAGLRDRGPWVLALR
jgi:ribosomal protein S18 acetylase RimI-like enzyme